MSRSVDEWIGKTADTDPPPRVKLRVFERSGGHCVVCTRKLVPKQWQCDHVVAIINGGENRESNLQALCNTCHTPKTAADVAEKARAHKRRKSAAGIEGKKRSAFATSRGGKWKAKIGGGAVRRDEE